MSLVQQIGLTFTPAVQWPAPRDIKGGEIDGTRMERQLRVRQALASMGYIPEPVKYHSANFTRPKSRVVGEL